MFTKFSPYYETPTDSRFIGHYVHRDIGTDSTDYEITLEPKYNERPGHLAYELYGTQELWWVFTVFNRDLIVDPVFDLKAGMTINVPTKDRLLSIIG